MTIDTVTNDIIRCHFYVSDETGIQVPVLVVVPGQCQRSVAFQRTLVSQHRANRTSLIVHCVPVQGSGYLSGMSRLRFGEVIIRRVPGSTGSQENPWEIRYVPVRRKRSLKVRHDAMQP